MREVLANEARAVAGGYTYYCCKKCSYKVSYSKTLANIHMWTKHHMNNFSKCFKTKH